MKPGYAEALRDRISSDLGADVSTIETDTDRRRSIGSDVWRLRWRNQVTTAVGEDADLHTTCGALLDALAVLETWTNTDDVVDRSTINVLVDRPLPVNDISEADQALRSLRDATIGASARLWYRGGDIGWVEDTGVAPGWPAETRRVADWVQQLQIPRLTATPSGLALALVTAVADPSLQLYPSEITHTRQHDWALRIDGLQIGIAGKSTAVLTVGGASTRGDGPQREVFTKVFDRATATVSDDPTVEGALTVAVAATKIRELLRRFRTADVNGAPLTHRAPGGVPIIDEHTLEARLLKGIVTIPGTQLVLDDNAVARGSQFPTLWGATSKPRYLDALLRRGRTPLAIELKVATGGQGRYYRRSLIQAALYAHYLRGAADLAPWFIAADLDQASTQAAIGIPIPHRCTPGFLADLELLKAVASHLDVEVHVLDDRATPDIDTPYGGEPDRATVDRLSWALAAALQTRYPKALGRVVELQDGGGQYDQIQLQAVNDRSITYPCELPRISLNRVGSAWVFNQFGNPSWTWRNIWKHLASGGDLTEAADRIARIAGHGEPDSAQPATFAVLASRLLHEVGDDGWLWRNAYQGDGRIADWASSFTRYARTAQAGQLPTIARLWGATRDGRCAVVVDQDSLRVWTASDNVFNELNSADPLSRIDAAVHTTQARYSREGEASGGSIDG